MRLFRESAGSSSRSQLYSWTKAHMGLLRTSILVSLGLWLALSAPAWSFEQSRCVTNAQGKVVCPPPGGTCLMTITGEIACSPPFGGIVRTLDGQMLCGPGKCMISAFGQAFCSAEMYGSATISSFGEPVCTGGCVSASVEACSWP